MSETKKKNITKAPIAPAKQAEPKPLISSEVDFLQAMHAQLSDRIQAIQADWVRVLERTRAQIRERAGLPETARVNLHIREGDAIPRGFSIEEPAAAPAEEAPKAQTQA